MVDTYRFDAKGRPETPISLNEVANGSGDEHRGVCGATGHFLVTEDSASGIDTNISTILTRITSINTLATSVNTVLTSVNTLAASINTLQTSINVGVRRPVVETNIASANTAINATVTPTAAFRLKKVQAHFGTAPAAVENFSVWIDDNHGSAYDTTIFSRDPSVGSLTDIVAEFSDAHCYANASAIVVNFVNTNAVVHGVVVTHELI